MNWRQNLRLSLNALRRTPLRTLLSASATAVGTAAVAIVVALGNGAAAAYLEALERMGENLLAVSAGRTESGGPRGPSRQVESLTLDDARALTALERAARVAPMALRELPLRHGKRSLRATVIGTTAEFRLTHRQFLAAGRFLDAADHAAKSRVAVIGDRVWRELFFGQDPLGERLQIGGVPFVVVGRLREKGIDPTGADEDNRVLVPAGAFTRRLLNIDFIDRIFVQATSRDHLGPLEEEIRQLLRERHGAEDFEIHTQAALLAALRETDRSFSYWTLGLATLTLGLGGAGLMAVSFLAVRERRGEIGLRLAVGALPCHVLLQFLAETVMIAALGGIAGLLAGGAGIMIGQSWLGWQMAWSWTAAAWPFLISLAIAVVCGTGPAVRAAGLDPVDALQSS